jgi:hypothetical protein
MATEAKAIDVLMSKGNFEPQVALAIAEAVAVIMTDAQVVTVPVLDARVAELKAGIKEVDHKVDLVKADLEKQIVGVESRLGKLIESTKSELVRWVLLAMLGSGAIQAGAAAFINAVQHH